MERLDPTVEHLGEAGHGGHVGDRQSGLAQRPCRAAGRDQLEALGDQPSRELDQAGLVGDREQRPPRHGDPLGGERRGRSERGRPRCVIAPASRSATARGRRRCSAAWIRARRASASSVARTRHRLLEDDRTAVEHVVDEVDRAAGHGHAGCQGIVDGAGTGERRQERGMDVEDPSGIAIQDDRADDAHVAGQDDRVRRRLRRGWRPAPDRRRPARARSGCPRRSPSRGQRTADRRRRGRSVRPAPRAARRRRAPAGWSPRRRRRPRRPGPLSHGRLRPRRPARRSERLRGRRPGPPRR